MALLERQFYVYLCVLVNVLSRYFMSGESIGERPRQM